MIWIPKTIKIIFVALSCIQSPPKLIEARQTESLLDPRKTFWNMSSQHSRPQVANVHVLELIFAEPNKEDLTMYVDLTRFDADLLQLLSLGGMPQDSHAIHMERVYNKLLEQFGDKPACQVLLSCSNKSLIKGMLEDLFKSSDLDYALPEDVDDIFIRSRDKPISVRKAFQNSLSTMSFYDFMTYTFPAIYRDAMVEMTRDCTPESRYVSDEDGEGSSE